MKYLIPSFALLLLLPASSNGQTRSKTPAQSKTAVKPQKTQPHNEEPKNDETIVLNQPGRKDKTVVEIIDNNLYINGDRVTSLNDKKANKRIVINNEGSVEHELSKDAFDSVLAALTTSRRVMLGIFADDYGVAGGAEITGIMPNTPAEKAGLRQGDIIVRINDHEIKKAKQMISAINENKAGEKISVTYLRQGSKYTVDASVIEADPTNAMSFFKGPGMQQMERDTLNPNIPMSAFDFENDPFLKTPKMGITAEEDANGKGILVQDVNANSPAADAGLRKGDIITRMDRSDVKTVEDLMRQLRIAGIKKNVKLYYLRSGEEQATDLHLSSNYNKKDM